MTRDEFGAALRSALKSLAKPAELANSPLLRTRLLADWADGETPAPAMIGELVEVALSSASTDDRPRRCVELTFVRGAPTQEAAAERLGLSFSTYRRQLERGVEAVIDYLWNRELRRP
jgi:DNA-directed RNA polymerase specialized sigma24 family protein